MMRARAAGVVLAIVLVGCAEKAQTVETGSTKKSDEPAWQAGANPYLAPGWKPGEKGAWEAQLRNRAQAQNDFAVAK